MARTAIISPNPASRVWRGRSVRRSRSIRALRAKCHPPRVSSAADFLVHGGELRCRSIRCMPRSANGADLAATDKFTFVRDGLSFLGCALQARSGSSGIGCGWRCSAGSCCWSPSISGSPRSASAAARFLPSTCCWRCCSDLKRQACSAGRCRGATGASSTSWWPTTKRSAERRFFDRWTAQAARPRQRSMRRSSAGGAAADPRRSGPAVLETAAAAAGRDHRLVSGAGRVAMSVAIIDYGSGNLHSAAKAFERAAREHETRRRSW